MKRSVKTLAVLLLAGCGGSNAGPPVPNGTTPAQSATLDARHASVTIALPHDATVTVALPSGMPPPAVPIGVSASSGTAEPAVVTLTANAAVSMTAAPAVVLHAAAPLNNRVIAESCRDGCTFPTEQLVSPSSPGVYGYQDSAPVALGGNRTFSVTFASLPNYRLTDLSAGSPFSGITPAAINDSDAVVATGNSAGSTTGIVYSNGAWMRIPAPAGQSDTQPFAISNTGVIVGSSGNRAFRYAAGVSTVLGQMPPVRNEINQRNIATAISQDGKHIVGYTDVETYNGQSYADFFTATDFSSSAGAAPSACLNTRSIQANNFNTSVARGVNSGGTLVGVIASSNTLAEDREIYACPVQQALGDGTTAGEANAINEAGDVAGYLWPQFEHHTPILYSGGVLKTLPVPAPYTDGIASLLNNGDELVGTVFVSTQSETVVWRDGIAIPLNDLLPANCAGWTLVTATGINNRGDLVGTATKGGVKRAYLLQIAP